MILSNIKDELINVPIAVSAIALGFMGLSTAYLGFGIRWVRFIAFIFCITVIGLIALKAIFHTDKVREEIKHPLLGSVYPTIFMAIMIISTYIFEFNTQVAKLIWISAIISHFTYSINFFKEMYNNFNLENLLPSWFIVTAGIGIGAVTGKPMDISIVSNGLFLYSLIMFIVIFPTLIYRIKKYGNLNSQQEATMMIIASPPNICLAAYMVLDIEQSYLISSMLAIGSYLSIIYNYTLIPRLIKNTNLPQLAPLTFPLSIGVVACQRYVNYLKELNTSIVNILEPILYLQTIVATIVIGYIVIKTVLIAYKKIVDIKYTKSAIAYEDALAVTNNEED